MFFFQQLPVLIENFCTQIYFFESVREAKCQSNHVTNKGSKLASRFLSEYVIYYQIQMYL